jgi:peroxiredoxin
MRVLVGKSLRQRAWIALFGSILLPAAGLLGEDSKPAGAEARELTFKDTRGAIHSPLSATGQKATAFFFVLHDCTLCNAYAPEINRLVNEYVSKGIRSYVVYAEAGLSAEDAAKHAADYGFTCPALLDPDRELAGLARQSVAPGAAVISPERAVLYRGRIDDRVVALGKIRAQPGQRDLKVALDCVISGKPVPTPVTTAIGCYIQSRPETKPHEK